jgi:hypothetical protein
MVTKETAINLKYRTILEHKVLLNADGTPMRVRVNGKCKVWKTRPEEFRLPVKHALNYCFYITEKVKDEWRVSE